jgi:hypothetical protein
VLRIGGDRYRPKLVGTAACAGYRLLRPFPPLVELVEVQTDEGAFGLHGAEPRFEAVDSALQGQFGVNSEVAGQIGDREQEVADLVLDAASNIRRKTPG